MKPDQIRRIKELAGEDTIIVSPVALRLEAADQKDVDQIAARLLGYFGETLKLTSSRQIDGGRIWVVYGTFI